MTHFRLLSVTASALLLASCTASDIGTSSSSGNAYGSRATAYRCSDGVQLTVSRSRTSAQVSDSRGYEATLPVSPADRNRYTEGKYTLQMNGSDVSLWYVLGDTPVADCRR